MIDNYLLTTIYVNYLLTTIYAVLAIMFKNGEENIKNVNNYLSGW